MNANRTRSEHLADMAVERYIKRHKLSIDPDKPSAIWDQLWEQYSYSPSNNPLSAETIDLELHGFAAWLDMTDN